MPAGAARERESAQDRESGATLHDPRAEQASRDFNEFIKHEPSTADTSALTEKIESHSVDKTSDVNSNKFDRGRLHY